MIMLVVKYLYFWVYRFPCSQHLVYESVSLRYLLSFPSYYCLVAEKYVNDSVYGMIIVGRKGKKMSLVNDVDD